MHYTIFSQMSEEEKSLHSYLSSLTESLGLGTAGGGNVSLFDVPVMLGSHEVKR